ncbi:terminase family protein [uncultured Arcobacter sp.]|uniref:terminase large subunit domain-containing protein n=1 Tax=uncultured Arcobacter sp. TaxID=165434 RepID=UPI0026248E88|nr:terminase family protein [uncultured Arcobacter sp.]
MAEFIKEIETNRYEVLTPNGFESFQGIGKTIKYDVYELILDNDYTMQCADDHIVMILNGYEIEERFVKELSVGDLVLTESGFSPVRYVLKLDNSVNMYDLLDVDSHIYYTNGIASHNSQCTAGYILYYILFHSNKNCAILANKQDIAVEILSRVKMMYESLPLWLQEGIISWNKTSIALSNGSTAFARATSASAIRGKSCNILVIDETAHVSNGLWDEFYTSSYPVVSSSKDAKIILISTPLGMNFYYKMYMDAVNGRNGFKHFTYDWTVVPNRDEDWAEKTKAEIGERRFIQEFAVEFLGSNGTLVSVAKLQAMPILDAIEKQDDEKLKIYEQPKKDGQYVIIADVGEGVGCDSSTCQVLDVSELPYRQVAVYRDNLVKTNMFPYVIDRIGRYYNNALVIVESNTYGQEVLNILNYDIEYENIFYDDAKDGFGLRMTKLSKRLGNSYLKDLIEYDKIQICDYQTVTEFSTYIQIKGSYGAEEGKTDDMITPLVLFAFFINNNQYVENWLDKEDFSKTLHKNYIDRVEEQVLPEPMVFNGNDDDFF